ncbi:MAG: hypothetical protein IPL59_08215 [Candidatus Competibacteraceae bacterium]|nr:hypothetical protein [Candidatus Competibacteraceae bacterium]
MPSGQIVGESKLLRTALPIAFLYSGGQMSDLGTPGGANSSSLGYQRYWADRRILNNRRHPARKEIVDR